MKDDFSEIGKMFEDAFRDYKVESSVNEWTGIDTSLIRHNFVRFSIVKFNIYYASLILLSAVLTTAVGIDYFLLSPGNVDKGIESVGQVDTDSTNTIDVQEAVFQDDVIEAVIVKSKPEKTKLDKAGINKTLYDKSEKKSVEKNNSEASNKLNVEIQDEGSKDSITNILTDKDTITAGDLSSVKPNDSTKPTIKKTIILKKDIIIRDTVIQYKTKKIKRK